MPYPTSLGARITPQQEKVLLKAMAVDYQDRYQTMAEFKDAIFQGASRKTSVKPESLFKDISPRRTHPETQNPPQENISSGPEKKPQSQEATATKKSPKWMIASAFVILIGIISIILGLSSGTSSESVSLSARETIPATMPTKSSKKPSVLPANSTRQTGRDFLISARIRQCGLRTSGIIPMHMI